ncbi:MAG: hypothetical protein V1860_00970 [bacterium]
MSERFSGGAILENYETKNRVEYPKRVETEYFERVDKILAEIAKEQNDFLRGFGELKRDIINPDCSINMRSFMTKGGEGIYQKDDIKKDEEFIREKEEWWSGGDDETDEDKKRFYLAEWTEDKKRSSGILFEKVITIILHKMLRKEFFVSRASKFDDYANGVDTIIINKETGGIICAFDEVTGDDVETKENKVIEKDEKGGASIKYGITFEKNNTGEIELIKKEIKNVPTFYLGLPKSDLRRIANKMAYNTEEKSEAEIEICKRMVMSLKEQLANMLNDLNIYGSVKENLKNSNEFILRMQGLIHEEAGYN